MMIELLSTEVTNKIASLAWDLLGSDGLLEPVERGWGCLRRPAWFR